MDSVSGNGSPVTECSRDLVILANAGWQSLGCTGNRFTLIGVQAEAVLIHDSALKTYMWVTVGTEDELNDL